MPPANAQTHTEPSTPALRWLPASRPFTPPVRIAIAVLGGSALLALSAHIAVPLYFTPVPFTMQPLAVLLLGLLLDPTVAFATLLAYLLEGAAGLPVFAPGPGGLLDLMSPSGGYLLAYPFAVTLVSKLYRSRRPTFTWAALSAAAGAVVYFTGGASWLAVVLHQPASIALKLAVWPFLAGDALKIVLAAAIVTGLARIRSRSNTGPAL
ncbi:MAG TPA: biotin transporter BioY [Silvibacterium sp.]|nr:biotin transporter BioY [Silvibacterium sp.]